MTAQPGLFDLPDPPPTSPAHAARDRGKRGERWTRTVVADLHVVDSATLRDAARRRLSDGITIDLGPADDDPDLLDPHEEITTSAAAVRWWIEPTTGTWPQLAEALRLDAVDLDTTDESPQRVHARWSVTVTITDIHLLRRHIPSPDLPDDTFGARFRRFHRRFGQKGGKKAATATAHTLIVIIWHVLAESSAYHDRGSDYFTRRIDSPRARERRLIRELEALGHKVTLEPTVAQPVTTSITDQPDSQPGHDPCVQDVPGRRSTSQTRPPLGVPCA